MERTKTDINALPEGCVANAISLTNPVDSCRLVLVNSTFRCASQSDAVWERFLPPDYLDIIARSNANPDVIRSFSSKKELFLYLCDNQILVDGGKKSFWLEKGSGKKCYMLSARDLEIVWGDTPLYWEWINYPGSRFEEVAKLLHVCWLEICGEISTSMLSPNTTYVAYAVFSAQPELRGFDHPLQEATFRIKGQDSKTSMFRIKGQDSKTISVCLDPITARERRYQPYTPEIRRFLHSFYRQPSIIREYLRMKSPRSMKCPVQRDDCWMEVELGEFHVQGTDVVELEMSLMEVKGGNWKSGLIIQGFEIRPKRVK